MNIGPTASPATLPSNPVSSVQGSGESRHSQLQAQLLKKILDSQQTQSQALANELEGKGSVLDIRA